MSVSRRFSVVPAPREVWTPARARRRRFGPALVVAMFAGLLAGPLSAEANPSLYLVDSQFPPDLQSRIFSVDRSSGALEVVADLGTDFSPVLELAAAR